jgi:hypothetical protein
VQGCAQEMLLCVLSSNSPNNCDLNNPNSTDFAGQRAHAGQDKTRGGSGTAIVRAVKEVVLGSLGLL